MMNIFFGKGRNRARWQSILGAIAVTISFVLFLEQPLAHTVAQGQTDTETDTDSKAILPRLDSGPGTYAKPRGWSGQTTVGAIHYYRGMFFAAKFTGDPSDHNWYFPTKPESNNHWEYLDTPVAWITTADPQFPWTEKTDNGEYEPEKTQWERSANFIVTQYASMEDYRKARPEMDIPVIINGDMTAFGHGDQRDRLHLILSQRFPEGNYFYGLGNHDYENNVNDCANNGCAKDSMLDLIGHIESAPKIATYDYTSETRSHTYRGSFAYAIFLGPIILVQLNNSPTYERSFSSGRPIIDIKRHFYIEPSINFLRSVLAFARVMGRPVIINVHRSHSDNSYNLSNSELPKLMNEYGVAAVYAGHYHSTFGISSNASRWGRAVLFYSSSPIYKKYLVSEYYPRQKILRVYGVTNNQPENKELMKEISM